jgi:hypothetical protein
MPGDTWHRVPMEDEGLVERRIPFMTSLHLDLESVEAGVPLGTMANFVAASGKQVKDMYEVVTPERALKHREERKQPLTPDESDKPVRLVRVNACSQKLSTETSPMNRRAPLLGAGRLFLERGLNVLPDFRAGIVYGQKEFGLLRDVLEITHQRTAVLALFQVLLLVQIFARLEQAGKLVLKDGAIDGGSVRSFPDIVHSTTSFLWPDFKRSRSFIRALCNCDLLFPMEHSSMVAISLCS